MVKSFSVDSIKFEFGNREKVELCVCVCACVHVCVCMCACVCLFAIDHKNVILNFIYTSFVKSRIDENNNVCDVKFITTYTNLVYH